MKPIVFFGTEEFSAVSLQALIDANFEIAGIVTKPDSKRGRGQKIQKPTVKIIGEKFKIPVIQPSKMDEIIDFVKGLPIRPIGVLVSFGRIIPQKIIDIFDGGIINVHPSLLPKYRGPSPIETAILNGDSKTGVSIMSLVKEMDAGPVFTQIEFNLSGEETAHQLYQKCGEIGAKMLTEFLPKIIQGKITASEQDHINATYCYLLSKEDSILNPEKISAKQAEQQIRAFEIFPKTKLKIGEHLCIINSAEVSNHNLENSPLFIKFADGKFLKIKTITTPNGKKTTANSFKNGYLTKK